MAGAISRDALLYHAIQRVYRPAVIGYIRRRMATVYGAEAPERLQQHFTAEVWGATEREATRSRAAGIIKGKPADAFDLLDVSNLHVVLSGEYDVLFPLNVGETKEARNERKNALVAWARVVRSARNPLSHPIEAEIDAGDVLGCIASARMVLGLVDVDAETDLKSLMESLSGDALTRETTIAVFLPPSESVCPQFVGREEYLAELAKWLDDPDQRRHLLAGSGGRGKTAIAYEFARRLRDTSKPEIDAIVWLSAKRRAFIDGEARSIPSTDFTNLEQALAKLLSGLGREDQAVADPVTLREAALAELSKRRCLIVVDDVDTLTGKEESVHEFFLEASFTTSSKFLFTSRRAIHGLGAVTTHVAGLSEAEGMSFIAARAELFGLPTEVFTESRSRAILEVTDRTPLYVEDLLRLIGSGVAPDAAIRAWALEGGEEARAYALQREIEYLSPGARHLLIAGALPDLGASLPELRVVTGLEESALAAAVGELVDLFLVPRQPLLGEAQAFLLESNTRNLVRHVGEKHYPDDYRVLSAARKIVSGQQTAPPEEVLAIVAQASFLAKAQRTGEAETVLLRGLTTYPEHPDLLAELAWVYASGNPARIADARTAFERAHELGTHDPGMYRRWLRLELETGQLTIAVSVSERSLERADSDPELLYLAGLTHSRRAREFAIEGRSDTAAELSRAELLLARAVDSKHAPDRTVFDLASAFYALASLLREKDIGDGVQARESRLREVVKAWSAYAPRDERIREFAEASLGPSRVDAEPPTPTDPSQWNAFTVGDRIDHPSLGDGLVQRVLGEAEHQVLEVEFARLGIRRVLAVTARHLAPQSAAASFAKR